MCNDYEQQVAYADYLKAVREAELEAQTSESEADLPRADDIKVGDLGPVVRAKGNGIELIMMTFGWPPARPKAPPTFNFKSDGRSFADSRRCLVVCSGFYEFTGTKYPKAKHRFRLKGSPVMAIAGLWSDKGGELGFTMLTTAPGPDVAPYHDRQVVVLGPKDWAHWLFLTKPETELLKPLTAGALTVDTVRSGSG